MKLVAICLGLLCVALFAVPARAAASEADRATARALALEGHDALQKKDYATAADRFQRADALVHAPTLVVDWARALQGLGRFVEAHEKYELVLREGVANSAPKSWTRALEDAKRELDALKPRLAWVTVMLKDPSDASVKIDGVVVPPAAVGVKRAADPGFPEVTVTAPGYEAFKQTVTIGPGEEKVIEVSLQKLPELATAPAADNPYRAQRTDNHARRFVSYVLFGVGGVGIVGGAVTGGLALHKRSDLKAQCLGDTCPSSSAKTLSRYHTYGTTSAVGFALGVAGLGTGLALLLTEPHAEESARAGLTLHPVLGLGTLGAEGTF
jgi:hypothetical protein